MPPKKKKSAKAKAASEAATRAASLRQLRLAQEAQEAIDEEEEHQEEDEDSDDEEEEEEELRTPRTPAPRERMASRAAEKEEVFSEETKRRLLSKTNRVQEERPLKLNRKLERLTQKEHFEKLATLFRGACDDVGLGWVMLETNEVGKFDGEKFVAQHLKFQALWPNTRQEDAQEFVKNELTNLVMGVMWTECQSCPPNSEKPGTALWVHLHRSSFSKLSQSQAMLAREALVSAGEFGDKDFLEFHAAITGKLNDLRARGKEPTLEELLVQFMLWGMEKNKRWEPVVQGIRRRTGLEDTVSLERLMYEGMSTAHSIREERATSSKKIITNAAETHQLGEGGKPAGGGKGKERECWKCQEKHAFGKCKWKDKPCPYELCPEIGHNMVNCRNLRDDMTACPGMKVNEQGRIVQGGPSPEVRQHRYAGMTGPPSRKSAPAGNTQALQQRTLAQQFAMDVQASGAPQYYMPQPFMANAATMMPGYGMPTMGHPYFGPAENLQFVGGSRPDTPTSGGGNFPVSKETHTCSRVPVPESEEG